MVGSKYKRYATGACLALTDSGVLIVTMDGPLTEAGINAIKSAVIADYSDRVLAFVADYRRSLIALDGAVLDSLLVGEQPHAAPQLPAALLVRQDSVELFAGHALRMAQHAIMRRVFLDEAQALGWAEERARRLMTRRASSARGP